MSAPRARSSIPANRRCAHPDFPGVPWWAAVLIAAIPTLIGFVFSTGSHELGGAFASMYAIGCVAAVLAVQQAGIFTAIIQPPLLLFVAVPGSYFVFHGGEMTGLKDTLINYGYPLIERFPLMLFTSAGVLLIGLVRWYFAAGSHSTAGADTPEDTTAGGASIFTGLAASVTGLFNRTSADEDDRSDAPSAPTARPRRRHSADRSASAQRRSRAPRTSERSAPTRSRHARPPLDDDLPVPRPRRSSGRRVPREPRDPGQRSARTPRRESEIGRDAYDRGSRRSSRFEPPRADYDAGRYRPEPSEYRPRHGSADYERPKSRDRDSSGHHPISQVRYRGAENDEPGRTEYESRSRRSPNREPDWRYDR